MEKPTGIKLPTAFSRTLEIEKADSHIPSATAATVNLTQNQNPKGPSPLRPTFAHFRLILQLEKTGSDWDLIGFRSIAVFVSFFLLLWFS
jgi:hypothetical protein